MREILERGRSRGYVLSLAFTLLLLVGGFVLPQLLLADQATRLALVEPVPAGIETAIQAGAAAFDLDLDISTIPDRAAAVAALTDGTINAALAVPADLSTAGELIVLERASDQLQAVASAAVVSVRAADVAPLLVPPAITAL
jgi:ABC-2 type transport system permease protein